ncbi:hypothetical protein Poli38472_007410 [Pythium oligandrum]|uniref:Large ribosomal subunit protein mL54 n=1 Tax=Pythium oligandrum TaxID=41045 RepID=A0A8K1FRM8_PYTOL|nr:hypothetical protein Poli38472_007410 [Pythium oligandrum]|eukprot:TMW67738.1 hypothetical protein Poli38472_007410 [Pythium oligandrum]
MLARQVAAGAALFKRAGVRAFAAPGKGKGGGGAAIVEEAVDLTRFVPTNILKEGAHPELKEKDEYPAWLFTLLDTKPTVGELERQGFDNLSLEEQRRYLTLTNRKIVKTNNAAKSKK